MSLNLGTAAYQAAASLKHSEAFGVIRAALYEQVRAQMNAALDVAPEKRVDALGYVRALRDLHLAIENATTGTHYNALIKPGPAVPVDDNGDKPPQQHSAAVPASGAKK